MSAGGERLDQDATSSGSRSRMREALSGTGECLAVPFTQSDRRMRQALPAPQSGQIVRVRQRQYLVEQVVAAPSAADATLVELSCLDDDAQGQELQVLWEAEPDGEILAGTGWDHLARRGFDPPR